MRQADRAPDAGVKQPLSDARRRQIAQIQIARKDLAMDEGTYRAVLVRVTGERSLTQLDLSGLERVVAEMRRLGFMPSGKRPVSKQPHVRKVYAIWTSMASLLEDSSRAALRSFVLRQTGVASPDWLDGAQANKAIEGLKAWRARLAAGAKDTSHAG